MNRGHIDTVINMKRQLMEKLKSIITSSGNNKRGEILYSYNRGSDKERWKIGDCTHEHDIVKFRLW